MRKALILLGFAAIVVMGFSAVSHADVIDFEDLNVYAPAPVPSGYAGFNWSSYSYVIGKYYHPGSGYDYGTQGNVSLFGAYAYGFSFSNTNPFYLNGMYITSAWAGTQNVTVEGYRNGSLMHTKTVLTSNDKAYWFDFNYDNIDTVLFKQSADHIDVDNITYNQQGGGPAVPEPASMSLLGIGLLGAIGAGLKKKK